MGSLHESVARDRRSNAVALRTLMRFIQILEQPCWTFSTATHQQGTKPFCEACWARSETSARRSMGLPFHPPTRRFRESPHEPLCRHTRNPTLRYHPLLCTPIGRGTLESVGWLFKGVWCNGNASPGVDGRRRFTPEFKRDQVGRVLRGELTMAELSRELSVSHSLVRRWKQLIDRGSETAVGANDEVVPASELRVAQQRIRELERALGRKTMEVEILQAARDEVKKRPNYYGVSKQ